MSRALERGRRALFERERARGCEIPSQTLRRDHARRMGRGRGAHAIQRAGAGARGGGRPRAWTEDRLEAELRAFIGEGSHWPSASEFKHAGRMDLYAAVKRSGGHAAWAERFGLPRAPVVAPPEKRARHGGTRKWTDERLEAALREFIGERPYFPTAEEFERAGRHDLRNAVKKYGGTVRWAARLGKVLGTGQDRRPYGREDAVRDARKLIAEHGHLPGTEAVRQLGYPRLATFIQVQSGGTKRFIEEFLSEPDTDNST